MPPSEATRSSQRRPSRHLADLWPPWTSHNTDPTPGQLTSGCPSACQTGFANCRCHLFFVWPLPPLPPCLGGQRWSRHRRTKKCLFSLRPADGFPQPPPIPQYVIYIATLQILSPYYMYNTGINNESLLGFAGQKQHAAWSLTPAADKTKFTVSKVFWSRMGVSGVIHLDKCFFGMSDSNNPFFFHLQSKFQHKLK